MFGDCVTQWSSAVTACLVSNGNMWTVLSPKMSVFGAFGAEILVTVQYPRPSETPRPPPPGGPHLPGFVGGSVTRPPPPPPALPASHTLVS